MKIAVYSICKNEIDQVDGYMSHLDALGLKPYILDHSTDGTTEKLRARGAIIDTTPIEDWWWDRGKNAAMDLVDKPVDFCVNIDLDERLSPDFWKIVDKVRSGTKLVQHLYKPEGGKERMRYDWRLHARHGARWVGPVHEYLECLGEPKLQLIEELLITHWPPPHKNHVPVETVLRAVKAFPDDIRIKALCGRELFFSDRIDEAIDQFRDFLAGDSDNELDVCYAHRMLGKCYDRIKLPNVALHHYQIAATFQSREALVDLAYAYILRHKYQESYAAAVRALNIADGQYLPNSDPDAWSWKPHELISVALYYCGHYDLAAQAAATALKTATGKYAERLTASLETMREAADEAAKKKA